VFAFGCWVVYRIVRRLPADLLILARQGIKAYSEAFNLVYRREAAGPNAIRQVDHSPLDILLIRAYGEPQKPCPTIILDDYSRADWILPFFRAAFNAADLTGVAPRNLAER